MVVVWKKSLKKDTKENNKQLYHLLSKAEV